MGFPVAMTIGDCCHLPGCKYDFDGSPRSPTSYRPPKYVAQVTSRDGLDHGHAKHLSPFCRIRPEGGDGERLPSLSTLGAMRKSHLERWLSSADTSS